MKGVITNGAFRIVKKTGDQYEVFFKNFKSQLMLMVAGPMTKPIAEDLKEDLNKVLFGVSRHPMGPTKKTGQVDNRSKTKQRKKEKYIMSGKVNKSRILGKIKKRSKGAWKKSRSTEAHAKGQQLPGGIIRGVAQFSSSKFGETEKGVPFVSLTGIVHEPAEHAGARATIFHRFTETDYKTVEDVMNDFSSNMQLLGCETEDTTEDDWEDLLKTLGEEKPFFFFNTSAWEFNGRSGVSVFIQGLAEDWDAEEDDAEEDDAEEDDQDFDFGDAPDTDEDDSDDADDAEDDSDEDDSDDTDEDDADEDDADEDDSDDTDEDDSDDTDEDDSDEDDDDDGEEEWIPAKGEVYKFKAPKARTATEAEVTTVNKKAETVSLKRVKDKRLFKDVPWDQLEGEE